MPRDKKALTLSIIIPAYNEEDYIKACLESIAAQTESPEEVIVVDNNSTDKTAEVVQKFSFVKLLREDQIGVACARDKGFNAASSDIIGRIDADTRLPVDWVSKLKEMLAEDQGMAAVSGPTGFYDLPWRTFNLGVDKIIRTTLYYLGFKEERYLFGSNMAIRRSAWENVRSLVCHDRGIHEDNDLAIHLYQKNYKVSYSNKLTADISVRRANSSLGDSFKYAFMQFQTFRHHNILSLQSLTAGVTLLMFYPWLRFLHRAYDPAARSFSLKRLKGSAAKPRKLPMD